MTTLDHQEEILGMTAPEEEEEISEMDILEQEYENTELSNVELHRRAKTKIEDKPYDYVPQNLFNLLELLNDRAT